MNPTAISVPTQRLARFETWARLFLLWFAGRLIAWYGLFAPIPRDVERELHRWLDNVARVIACVVLMRALARLARGPAPHSYRRYALPANAAQRTHINARDLRAIIGGELRQRLRSGSLSERFAALNAALADMDALVIKLVRRLARGLTRRRPIRPRPAVTAVVITTVALAPAAADTS